MKKKQEYISLKSISSPEDVKKYNYKELYELCSDIREEIIKSTSTNGGHLSSNLGTVELTVALHRSFSFPNDKLIFDVGHQSYTHKILTGRSSDLLNKKDGISGFQKRNESEYDCYEAGHAGTALSAAQGFALARKIKNENYNVIAVVGDGSIVNGLSFEALNSIANKNDKVIIVLNDNDMSISRPAGGLGRFFRKISYGKFYNRFKSGTSRALGKTKIGSFFYMLAYKFKNSVKRALVPTTMFDNMGFTYIGPIDGHDIKALEKAFRQSKNPRRSVIIHVLTKKGKGYKPAEKDRIGYWHGVTPFEIETGKPLNCHEGEASWSHFMGELSFKALSEHDNTYLICPAMIRGSGLDECFSSFPSRTIDVGIAEEHALTLGGALSINGIHPIVVIYSTFLQRAYDEVLHDCARMNTNMTLLIDRAGLVGSNGETHQGIYDVAFLKTIPNVTITMASTWEEAAGLAKMSYEEEHGVFAIRYPHVLSDATQKKEPMHLTYGKWLIERECKENDVALIAVGPLGKELNATLKKESKDVVYVNPLFLNPIDQECLDDLLKAKEIIIYDPYSTKEGLSDSILSYLASKDYRGKIICHCIPTEFIQFGTVSEQLERLGISIKQILKDFD